MQINKWMCGILAGGDGTISHKTSMRFKGNCKYFSAMNEFVCTTERLDGYMYVFCRSQREHTESTITKYAHKWKLTPKSWETNAIHSPLRHSSIHSDFVPFVQSHARGGFIVNTKQLVVYITYWNSFRFFFCNGHAIVCTRMCGCVGTFIQTYICTCNSHVCKCKMPEHARIFLK